MRLIFILLFALFNITPLITRSQSGKEVQQQIQQAINDLKKQITDKEKQIAEAKKNKEDAETIKSMEDELALLKQQLSMMEKATKSIATIPSTMMDKAAEQVNADNDNTPGIIPAKKTALLNALPKDDLNKAQLQTFLNTLYIDLTKKISAEKVANVKKIINQLENDATNIAYSGVAAWYNKAPAQAALLIVYAASKSQDANTLNNCGAIMNLCGHEEKAIPVLKYVLVTHPDNSTVLNNLGQSYTGLGDKQTAMMYFARCIRQSPNHPEANATAAKIEESNGNMEKALEYTEASLRGAYSEERAEFFNKRKKNCSIRVLFNTQHTTVTKFFDPGALHIPPNCRSWTDCESVYPQQQQYFQMIGDFSMRFQQRVLQNQVTQSDILTMGESPFNKAALFKKAVIGDCYSERAQELFEDLQKKLSALVAQQQAEQRKLDDDFDKELKACPDIGKSKCLDKIEYKYCKLKESLDNKYFSLLADISDKYTQNSYTEDVGYYNNLVYLEAVSSVNEKALTATCGAYAVVLLGKFQTYVMSTGCNPGSKPNCEQYNPANPQNPNSPDFKDPQCPIGLKLSFGPGEVSLSCKSFAIEVGEFVKFGYEKDFITRESTLSMGPGVSADIPGILDAGASAKAYVKFDGNNQPIDVGLSSDVSIGVKGTTPIISAGYTMGVNSGFNYSGTSPF